MSDLIISVSGLRGILGTGLTPEVAVRYCAAFAQQAPAGPLVVTRDGRATGEVVQDTVTSALRAMGRDVLLGGIAATPTTGVLIRQLGAVGGIQISASHNPPQYNGLKLFGADGRVLPADLGDRILQHYRAQKFAWAPHDQLGTLTAIADTTSAHLAAVLEIVDVDAIRAAGFHVVLDANHGAGSVLGQRLLECLGVSVTALGGTPDGRFSHPPEPTAENLRGVCEVITQQRAAVGFCQDPDADRLALIDEQGRYIGEEFTVAICLKHVLEALAGPVVTNCSTSRMSEDIAGQFDVPFYRSRVGEANVTQMMIDQEAVFGGEGNGGPIDPRVGYVRDSFVGMALVLDAMAGRKLPVSALAEELPQYAIHKTKVTCAPEAIENFFDQLEIRFSAATANRLDGLRLDWPDRWLLVRPSNTEPIVRIIAEAPTQDAAQELCQQAAEVMP